MDSKALHTVFETDNARFTDAALALFRVQARENIVYKDYLEALRVDPAGIRDLLNIPFLPIRFFKSHLVTSGQFDPELVFESSGTTGMIPSRHFVRSAGLYEDSFMRGFEIFYGPVKEWCILGLLPSYLEREHSSLVYMVNTLIRKSGHPQSGFFLNDLAGLKQRLFEIEKNGQKTLLIGVSFALLDFALAFPMPLRHTVIMETGGMKGRKKEMLREEVHEMLKRAFGLTEIHAEYGMTELLSQAYSKADGLFYAPPWMRVLVRDDEDPLEISTQGAGAINIIDLANQDSCAFIATDDVGRIYAHGGFEVLGRLDGSDLRGCSLLVV